MIDFFTNICSFPLVGVEFVFHCNVQVINAFKSWRQVLALGLFNSISVINQDHRSLFLSLHGYILCICLVILCVLKLLFKLYSVSNAYDFILIEKLFLKCHLTSAYLPAVPGKPKLVGLLEVLSSIFHERKNNLRPKMKFEVKLKLN